MALSDDVTARVSATLLRQLTNPDDPDSAAASVDTTRLGLAAADASGDFLTYAQATYSSSNAQHVPVGVMGTLAYLEMWGAKGASVASASMERFHAALRDLRRTQAAGKRITPTTSSVRTPSTDDSDAKPWFDRTRFDDIRPDPPPGADTYEE